MAEYAGRIQKMHENITRKVEQLVTDMTRQLIAGANNDEDVEVEVKMLFGKVIGNPRNATGRKTIIRGVHSPEASSASYGETIISHYSSPVQQITTEEDETSM
ncbi:unnamed protein product [Wuchereria bancrofti]|uniref:Uncharacterized protein n=1 Tax=Wuchereria bancrofti TaxID=6293 RepID=A0A3P7E184_WUCBA|nr:unnamed protein product [Wuchereria bancrofti]